MKCDKGPSPDTKENFKQKRLSLFYPKTIINKEELEKELSKVKKRGFALDVGENEKDVLCVSAPIRNYQGKVIAAISISSPNFRLDINKQNYLKDILLQNSKRLSERLGYNNKRLKKIKK